MKTILSFLLGVSAIICGAQVPYFQSYNLLRKNERVVVKRALQDEQGYMWLGTDQGLFRFDGERFLRLTTADSLPDNQVTALTTDANGRVWGGCRNGHLFYVEGSKAHPFEAAEGSASAEISDIHFDRSGNLWFTTLNDGLYYLWRRNHRVYRIDEEEGMPDLFDYNISEGDDTTLWVGTDGGLAHIRPKEGKPSVDVIDYSRGLPDNIVKKVVVNDSIILVGTEDAGIFRYHASTGKFVPLLKNWDLGSLRDFIIQGREIWVATSSGVSVYDRETGSIRQYNNSEPAPTNLYADREGNIWIGSSAGLQRTPGDRITFIDHFDVTSDHNIIALCADHNQRLWFSNHDGLFVMEHQAQGGVVVSRFPLDTNGQSSVISLCVDSLGYVWAGLYGEGVVRINPESGESEHLLKGLRNGNILHITSSGKTIWLATLGGVTKIDITTNPLSIKNMGRPEGLISDFIYEVFVDSDKRVWFATDGKGAEMLDQDGFHTYAELNSTVVYGFEEDGKGTIWANVQGEGVYRLENGRFLAASSELGLRDSNINAMSADGHGNVLVMHDLGIDRFDPTGTMTRFFGEESGLHNQLANLNAVASDHADNIYFGTDGGIVIFSAMPHPREQRHPMPLITGIHTPNGRHNAADGLTLPYDDNDIRIDYIGFWFQDPGDLLFQYKLEGNDNAWIATRNSSVTYSRLAPGNYTFHLKVTDTDDFGRAMERSISFVVKPPFWRTTLFYVLAVCFSAAGGYSLVVFRERSLQADNRRLEGEVLKRTAEIRRKNDAIQAQHEEIRSINENLENLVRQRTAELERKNKALEEYAFINAHELRAPVASILGLIDLIDRLELTEKDRELIDHMQASARRLEEVVSQIMRAIERGDYNETR